MVDEARNIGKEIVDTNSEDKRLPIECEFEMLVDFINNMPESERQWIDTNTHCKAVEARTLMEMFEAYNKDQRVALRLSKVLEEITTKGLSIKCPTPFEEPGAWNNIKSWIGEVVRLKTYGDNVVGVLMAVDQEAGAVYIENSGVCFLGSGTAINLIT